MSNRQAKKIYEKFLLEGIIRWKRHTLSKATDTWMHKRFQKKQQVSAMAWGGPVPDPIWALPPMERAKALKARQ